MSRTIHDLREKLFDTLDDFRSGKIKAEDAKAVCEIGQIIINSAKVEVDHIKAVGSCDPSTFIDASPASNATDPEGKALPNGIVGVRRHLIKG